jgi:hypothetical protein
LPPKDEAQAGIEVQPASEEHKLHDDVRPPSRESVIAAIKQALQLSVVRRQRGLDRRWPSINAGLQTGFLFPFHAKDKALRQLISVV